MFTKKKYRTVMSGVAILLLITSNTAFAEMKAGLFVKYIQVAQGGSRAFMQFSSSKNGSAGAYTFSTGCQINDSIILDTQTADGKNMYALLMAAFVAKQPVEVNTGNCTGAFPRLLEVAFGVYP